eukprot:1193805-Prorocentrum_minimum.AAC.6
MLSLHSTRVCAPVHRLAHTRAQDGRSLRKGVATAGRAPVPALWTKKRVTSGTGGRRGGVVCLASKDAEEVVKPQVVELGAQQKEIDWQLLFGQFVKVRRVASHRASHCQNHTRLCTLLYISAF